MPESLAHALKQMQWRYSPKKFEPSKKLTVEQWHILENALTLSPSSYGLQPWRFTVVTNQEMKEKLKQVSFHQSQVSDCSHYVVMSAKEKMDESWVDRFIDRIIQVRGVPPESLVKLKSVIMGDVVNGGRSKHALEWATHQVYIALGHLIATAALIHVDTCPMEGFQPDKYDEILGLKAEGFKTVVCCAVGFRHVEDPLGLHKKVRFEIKDVIKTIA